MKPQLRNLGQIVHFVDYLSNCQAAIIVSLHSDGSADLFVIGEDHTKTRWVFAIQCSPTEELIGTWHYPERHE